MAKGRCDPTSQRPGERATASVACGTPMRPTLRLALALALALGGYGRPANPPPNRPAEPDRSQDGGAAGLQQAVDRLLDLMRQRLLVQHEVASFKWHARRPVTDPKREQELLDRA